MSCEGKKHILEVKDLSISFTQYEQGLRQRELKVIYNLDVHIHEGEVVAIVGSSGSGKSLLAHAILGILPENALVSGEIYYNEELLTKEKITSLRGNQIVLVPQSVNYLDPLMKIGTQIRKSKKGKKEREKQLQAMRRYELEDYVEKKYPFELSGGMARRVLVSTAVVDTPHIIIADEPTPGLHIDVAKKTLAHFRDLADEGAGVLLITHDIELAFEVADRIAVFYAGTTVEEALVEDFRLEETLRHPYTKALWRALPQNGFQPFPGVQPYAKDMPKGCPFGPRCPQFTKDCEGEIPDRVLRCGTVRCVHAV